MWYDDDIPKNELSSIINYYIGHMQIKNSTQLYAKLLVRALSHADLRIRLAAMIAIAEAAIDNLCFQMKVISIDTCLHFPFLRKKSSI